MRLCEKPGCSRKHKARGMCDHHYWAYRAMLPEVKEQRRAYFRGYKRKMYMREWRRLNWDRVRAIERRYQEKRKARFWLPPCAPGELIEACRLLRALKQEIKREHK